MLTEMEEAKHTPEPWWTNGREIGDMPMMYTKISNSISGNSYEEAEANAHRIVACVNACEGITNEELNSGGGFWGRAVSRQKEAIERLTKERDELAKWKEEAMEIFNPIITFEHPELKVGDSKTEMLIKLAKQRDYLLKALEDGRMYMLKSGVSSDNADTYNIINNAINNAKE